MSARRLALVLALLVWAAAPAAGRGESAAAAEPLPGWLQGRVEAFVVARLPDTPVHVSIPPAPRFVPAGLDEAEVAVEIATEAELPLRGEVPLEVVLRREGEPVARGVVTVVVRDLEAQVVAARELERGQRIGPDDVELRPGEPGRSDARDAARDPQAAIGRVVKRRVPRGTPLRARWLEEAPLVERGAPVRLRFERAGLRIDARGVARDTGGAGDLVRVLNPSSRRDVVGRVGEDGVVHVAF